MRHVHRVRSPLAPRVRAGAFAGVLVSALGVASLAHAGPTGGTVVAGSGNIQRPNASTTVVRQQSQSLAIDWTGFDVAAHERVQFMQPSASAAALNRVFSQLPSEIRGSITANGRVFIINPNGVVFAPGARVEVGGLMASTLDMDVEDFMNRRYRFAAPQGFQPGAVVNHGLIEAASGGDVALLGGSVHNDGVIAAELGHVVMGAGREALVDFDGDGLIRFRVDGETLDSIDGHRGAVVNSGEIRAEGGQVLMGAAVARGIVDRAINNEGIIRATSIDRASGTVRLSGSGGRVENSGIIDVSASASADAGSVAMQSDAGAVQRGRIRADAAGGDAGRVVVESAGLTLLDTGSTLSARAPGGKGGEVRVLGDSVAMLDDATIDVSGGFGGGTVRVGGDYQGANPSLRNARLTGIAAGARIRADATERGDGGRVIVWSDETTNFLGRISARGGPAGGDGGFAEVSGKQHLAFHGSADLGADAGARGTLLLDPEYLVITGGSGDGDSSGSTASFEGHDSGSVAGEILFSDDGPSIVYQSEIEAQSALADITLQATRSISTSGSFDNGALVLAPDSNLRIETRNRGSAETGVVYLIGSAERGNLDIVTQGTGTITVRSGAGGDRSTAILLPNLISASDIQISAGGGPSSPVLVFGTITGANVGIDATGAVTVVSGGRVVGGGNGTSVNIDATGITLLDGAANAATVANSGSGSVSLISRTGADVNLGENAIATDVGMLSIGSGRSILALNLTDVSDTVNEIVSAGGVSLKASGNIGRDDAQIEIGGVTDLMVELDTGNMYLSGSNGLGGAGPALSSLSLGLEPRAHGEYVIENFADQVFAFDQGAFGHDLLVREITSATPMDLSLTARNQGMVIGAAGIDLAAGGDVMLAAGDTIGEAAFDDNAAVAAEITTDGRVTLVAKNDIGSNGMLDLAAGPGGISTLEARSSSGAVRVNALGALRIEGSGVEAPAGGRLAAAGALDIAADVRSSADMTFSANADAARAGNDVTIAQGARVALDNAVGATLRFDAGDDIVLDGGTIETTGSSANRIVLTADSEQGGADGVTGRIAQTGTAASVTAARLSAASGGGIDLRTRVASLTADNAAAGDVHIVNEGDVDLAGAFRNRAQGGTLALIAEDGGIDTGGADVASTAGPLSLESRRVNSNVDAGVVVGSGGVRSAGADIAIAAADGIRLAGTVDSGAGGLSLDAGSAIEQLAGRISSAAVQSHSGASTTFTKAGNAIERLALNAGGDVEVRNGVALELGASTVSGDLDIDNAAGLRVAGPVQVAGGASMRTASGDIDGAGGHIEAGALQLDAAGGIGIASALESDVGGDLFVRSRGAGADGNIRIRERGDFATHQLQQLATDTHSAQSVSLAAGNLLTVDKDPVDSPNLADGDTLSLDAARIALANKISGDDVNVRFEAPVDVTDSVIVNLDKGLLTFEGNVSPGADKTLTIKSNVVFASGHVTGQPGSTLIIAKGLDLARDTTIEVDNLKLSGNPATLTGGGDLTLLPATHGKDIVLGGSTGLVPDITLATLEDFGQGRALNIGVPAFPTARSPLAGNVRVARALSVGDAVLTVGGLGDVMLDNRHPLKSDRRINVVAVGDRRVFPNLVAHDGGNIDDTDSNAGAAPSLMAPLVNVIAQGRVGTGDNALEIEVGRGGRVDFVTGAENAFINTAPAGQQVSNVAGNSAVLTAFRAQGFFRDAVRQQALARTVGLETTGLETTGLGELLYLDEGVFLLPEPYTTPVSATLLPALMDPDFPADRRPDDAKDDPAWQAFYDGALRDYVEGRYVVADNATETERAAAASHVEREWHSLIEHFEKIRARERAAVATRPAAVGGG